MPATFIDANLIPSVIRDSVDPEILKRAQSIEWSICRDSGNDEHGFVEGPRGLRRLVSSPLANENSKKSVQFLDDSFERPDSGFDQFSANSSPVKQLTEHTATDSAGSVEAPKKLNAQPKTNATGRMKKHSFVDPNQPFPIYNTNRMQLEGDVAFVKTPNAVASANSNVHYEKASKVFNECELRELSADDEYFCPNMTCTLNECEEETIETRQIDGNPQQLQALYRAMSTDTFGYLNNSNKSKSASMYALGDNVSKKETKSYASVQELNLINENERKWELCDGKWIRIGSANSKDEDDALDEPELERYAAERVKCTILLEPLVHEVKVTPVEIEFKRPIKADEEEEKKIQDPNLMWMRMAPTQYGPPFGTIGRRKGREEEWVGPPCELCHKQIEERRCMLAENRKFHCWHFSCSFCLKTLRPADFLIAEANNKPYCLNCHKREFPEISLVNLNLMEDKKTSNSLTKVVHAN